MKTKIAISALMATTAATPLLWQHQALGTIAHENAQLREQLLSLDALRDERNQLLPQKTLFDELQQRQSVPTELASLQQEAAKLRGVELDRRRALHTQLQQKQQAWQQAKENAQRLQADFDAVELSANTRHAMLTLGLAARIFATDNDDTFPTSFLQITNELADNYVNGFKGGIPMDSFEWVPHARPVSEMEPQLALFREKSPRQMPDGTWERYYTLCDGSAQILTSDTEDFSDLESSWIASDPSIPENLANLPAYQ